jgi:hypothetical protein
MSTDLSKLPDVFNRGGGPYADSLEIYSTEERSAKVEGRKPDFKRAALDANPEFKAPEPVAKKTAPAKKTAAKKTAAKK